MMRIFLFAAIGLLPLPVFGLDQGELPMDSFLMLEKLENFEANEKRAMEARIMEKRKLVAKALRDHLERETKAGKLDSALALKQEINRIVEDEKAEGEEEKVEKKLSGEEMAALKKAFTGKWEGFDRKNLYFSLNFDQELMYYQEFKWKLRLEDDGTLTVIDDDKREAKFMINKEGDELTGTNFKGEKVILGRWKG